MARVLGRIRLSRSTEESTSEDRQRELITKWAELHDHTIIGWARDIDVSGSKSPFDTPELGPWLRDRSGEWDMLVAWKLDRLGRTLFGLNDLFRWAQDTTKVIVCISDNIDLSTWVGRLVAAVLAGVAEGELENIRDRNRASQARLREIGRWHGGVPPFGYRAVKLDGGGFELVPDDETRGLVLDIFTRIRDGASVSGVAADLNEAGTLSPRGQKWTTQTLLRMIRSPYPIGQDQHNGEMVLGPDNLPLQIAEPLIPESLWREVNQALESRSRRRRLTHERGYLLGTLICDECEYPLYVSVQTIKRVEYRYWRCAGRNKYSNGCSQKPIPAADAEKHIDDLMNEIGNTHRRETIYIPADDKGAQIADVKDRLLKLALVSDLGLDGFTTKVKEQRDLLARLEAEPFTPAQQVTRLVEPKETYAEAWARMSSPERRELLMEAGIKLYVRDKKVVRRVTPGEWLRDRSA